MDLRERERESYKNGILTFRKDLGEREREITGVVEIGRAHV